MKKFVELRTITPIYDRANNEGGLVSLIQKDIFVNIDNISHFEEINLAYSNGDNHKNYQFYENVVKEMSFDVWKSPTVLKYKFENLWTHRDELMQAFHHLTFCRGVKIVFKAGLNPLDSSIDKPIYALNPASDFNS